MVVSRNYRKRITSRSASLESWNLDCVSFHPQLTIVREQASRPTTKFVVDSQTRISWWHQWVWKFHEKWCSHLWPSKTCKFSWFHSYCNSKSINIIYLYSLCCNYEYAFRRPTHRYKGGKCRGGVKVWLSLFGFAGCSGAGWRFTCIGRGRDVSCFGKGISLV